MKNASIQTKLFSLCILLVLITSISISIPYYLITKKEKETASQIRIHVAFEIAREDILNRMKNHKVQITEFLDQVSEISWGLLWYDTISDKEEFFTSSTYSSYLITIGEEFMRFSRLVSADRLMVYGLDKRLLVSYLREEDREMVGTYIVSGDGQDIYLPVDEYSQLLINQKRMFQGSLPDSLKTDFNREIPVAIQGEHFQEEGKLGMRIIAPIRHKKKIVGILVAETVYTQSIAQHYAAISKTQINLFASEKWSIGTLPEEKKLPPAAGPHMELIQLGPTTRIQEVEIGGEPYYQGRYNFTDAQGVPIGGMTASLSQKIEKREIQKMLFWILLITAAAILVSFFLAILFSRKTILSIHRLIKNTSAIANGNLAIPIDTGGEDELGVLAKSFLKMQQAITCQITELNNEINERKQAEKTIQKNEAEKAALEKQLHQAQKMEAIGTLAGGIAHDFNNILSVILGYSDLLQSRLPEDTRIRDALEQIAKAGYRAQSLVSQILAFSRHSSDELIPVRPDLILKEALEMLRASIPTTIKIKSRAQKCGTVIADPTQLHQIIMNLCTNAYHAMRQTGGDLKITLGSVILTETDIKVMAFNLSPGPYVRLEVSDTGHGMDKTTQLKIFDPYFTTKKKGEGTGLGLSVVHGVVKSCGGSISVYSEPLKGTTFCIYLPETDLQEEPVLDRKRESLLKGNEHILLVDDESPILQMEKQMLESLGYTITACNSSPLALAEFKNKSETIELVITDMTMPDMNGIELVNEIRKISPQTPIILCSGFSDLINEAKAKKMGISSFLMKPVLQGDLSKAIRRALDT